MNDAAAISGTFADFRTVKGRKVCQLVIEIPVEQADAALAALGGVPQPADPKWVAIARLDMKAIQKPASGPVRPGLDADEGAGSVPDDPAPAPKRKWSEIPPAQQAAIRLSEPDFWKYLGGRVKTAISDAEGADEALKWYFGIASKTTLNSPDFSERWRWFDNEFYAWQRDPRRSAA